MGKSETKGRKYLFLFTHNLDIRDLMPDILNQLNK